MVDMEEEILHHCTQGFATSHPHLFSKFKVGMEDEILHHSAQESTNSHLHLLLQT